MKYKKETDFINDMMPLIIAGFIPRRVHCYGEVPRYSGMNHFDILLVNRSQKSVMALEFKLTDYRGLRHQILRNKFIRSVGIINCLFKKDKHKDYHIYHYTGLDEELDMLIQRLCKYQWSSIYDNAKASVYYWAYLTEPSNFNAGFNHDDRNSFYQVYKLAIRNLQEFYNWKLDTFLVAKALGCYSLTTVKKYYNQVLSEKFKQ